jgi:hypothetical protein
MRCTLVLEDEIVSYVILILVTARNILGLGLENISHSREYIYHWWKYTPKILQFCAILPFDKVYTKNLIYWLCDGKFMNKSFIHHFICLWSYWIDFSVDGFFHKLLSLIFFFGLKYFQTKYKGSKHWDVLPILIHEIRSSVNFSRGSKSSMRCVCCRLMSMPKGVVMRDRNEITS